jgi:tetratricopeptide (TPR) repeat protein
MKGYPLALTQAGAYLNRTPASIVEYISEFDKTQDGLLRHHYRYSLQEDSQLALLTTWKISRDYLAGQHQDTSNLLKLWGFLNGSDIWYDLIARVKWLDEVQPQPQLQPNIQVPQWLRSLASKEFEFDRALRILAGFTLVQEHRSAGRFAVNSQLHAWCQHLTTSEEEKTIYIALAVNIVGGMVPENLSEAWSNQLRLEAHGRQIMHILRTDEWPRDVAKLSILAYYRIANLFKSLDERDLAIEMYEKTLPDVKKVLGSHNDTVLDILLSLGRLYHLEEDYAAAEKMYQQALVICQQTLGPYHDETLSTAHNLAHILCKRGKLKEAVVMYKQGLAAYTRIHGEEHQGVVACINNLAICYDEQGKSDQAARMYRKSIAGSKKIFGDAHPKTLDAMKNLSELYRTQGNIRDSKALDAQIKAANVNYTFDVTGNYEVHSD